MDKGDWDNGGSPESIMEFNRKWLSLCREKLKDNGTIWISGTHHNIFSIANVLTELGYKILNVITWAKPILRQTSHAVSLLTQQSSSFGRVSVPRFLISITTS